MKLKKRKGWALFVTAALLVGILTSGRTPVGKNDLVLAAEISASAENNYGLKNPVVKAVAPPAKTSHGLSNPRNDNGTVTWDCVYFGSYWQSDTNGDGVADQNDEKEPIKWRVLSVDGDDAFLLADRNLDVQEYDDTEEEEVTWETCTMRSWLNGTFLNNAFNESEQEAIKVTDVVNEDNSEYGTEGGNDTQDKVYLLSLSEVMNPEYGFGSVESDNNTRKAVNTSYVAAGGEINVMMESAGNTDDWWLRSPGGISDIASLVGSCGYVYKDGNDVHAIIMSRRVPLCI
ncbi:MAG: DUF6273 domain-containing protein [Roseburia sp.]|nr:DUF6273 domain-containing protein [Roseburia sp.]